MRTVRQQAGEPGTTRGTSRLRVDADGSHLDLTDGVRHISALPDRSRAQRIAQSLDHVLWQRIELYGTATSGVVAGTRRRRPIRLRVDGPTALGLLELGIPTVTRCTEASR